jgi:hypothetical protein
MKNVLVAFIAFAAGLLLGSLTGNKQLACNENYKSVELLQGIPDTNYVRGDSILIETEKQYSGRVSSSRSPSNGSLTLREPEEGVYKQPFSFKEDDYNLDVIVQAEGNVTNIDVEYFLTIKSKEVFRVDTLKIFRVDTLKTVVVEEHPFYDSFEFGFSTAAVITLTLILIF